MGSMGEPRVLIVAENASAKFGGEAILPLHYFRVLRRRGIEAWMIVHARTREELETLFPDDLDRIHFIRDSDAHKALWKMSQPLPARLSLFSTGLAMRVLTQIDARKLAVRLIAEHGITVLHQPIPVSPKEPSLLYDLGVPVVMGPMNGGMTFPKAFRAMDDALTRTVTSVGRLAALGVNRIVPGKYHATTLLASNPRTAAALPYTRGRVIELVENGVDLALWKPPGDDPDRIPSPPGQARFVFLGRLVDWKAVDIIIDAMARVSEGSTLDIIGDGDMRPALEARAQEVGVAARVNFVGWVPQTEAASRLRNADALLLPSVYECGGAVVLEAMATGLPCIATDWGGPSDYLNEDCGVLLPPTSHEDLVEGFARSMQRLADDPALRARLGEASRTRILEEFDWERKVDRILEIYAEAENRCA